MTTRVPVLLMGTARLLALALAALAWCGVPRAEVATSAPGNLLIEGVVRLPDGAPAAGAVVVSSAGGQVSVREDGTFELDVALPPEAHAIDLTAVWSGAGGTHSAHRRLSDLRGRRAVDAGALKLAASDGMPEWLPTFGEAPGTSDRILALCVFDDGTGPALYVGGSFANAGSVLAWRVARWDGERWSALGEGLDGWVRAMCVYDDGAGPALFVAGDFVEAGGQPASRVARWDGQAWSPLGAGMGAGLGVSVRALAVHDDGTGPALYAGGSFASAGGQPIGDLARWDGQSWSGVGGGLDGDVWALGTCDLGGGEALYAGGSFLHAGGISARRVARWDVQAWSALGFGLDSTVYALAAHDDGSGPALYVGGWFLQAGGMPANKIARWSGSAWSSVGTITVAPGSTAVRSLAVFDDGTGAGPQLFAGGDFQKADGKPASNLARWDGVTWGEVDGGVTKDSTIDDVYALAVHDDGSGPALFAGGGFEEMGGQAVKHVARWDASGWRTLGDGLASDVEAIAVFDDGTGPALFVGGNFTHVGGLEASCIAKWDGLSWSPLGSGITKTVPSSRVYGLGVFDDGSGPALFAAGSFEEAGGVPAENVARWDGQSWSALGVGTIGRAYDLEVFDDGGGPALYLGGWFTSAGGLAASGVARWDGQSWSPLGSGTVGQVYDLAVWDDGSGSALYVGGKFTQAGGLSSANVARWDGAAWSALGLGVNDFVFGMAPFDDGSGEQLYVTGSFTLAGGASVESVARWDGGAWSTLGGGLDGYGTVLAAYDDGSGPGLYVGGAFTSAGGVAAQHLARWDASGWTAPASGLNDRVEALLVRGQGGLAELVVGGNFIASAAGDSYLARMRAPLIQSVPGCYGNPASLTALSPAAQPGQVFSALISSPQLSSGLALLFAGTDQTDAAGCGVLVPGIGELLLGLTVPAQVGSGLLSAGALAFHLTVPNSPSMVGAEAVLHGAVIGVLDPGTPIELSNGLAVTIEP